MDTIAPDPANARLHPQANLDAIRGSLLAFGQQKPVLVDGRGVIVAGSGL
jgi:ParB-like chromosome segregation protein Spo0J